MPVYRAPVVYDETTKRQRPAACCEKISPEYIYFDVGSLLFADSANSLRVKDNKLICSTVSAQADNMLKYGNDGGAYLDCNDVMSNDRTNLLHIGQTDRKLLLTKKHLTDSGFVNMSSIEDVLEALISLDEHNALTIGSDGKLFVRQNS